MALIVVLGSTGCGGESSSSASPDGTSPPESAETAPPEPVEPPPPPPPPPPSSSSTPCSTKDEPWQEGMFCPSENFHQYCADLSKAFSADAKQGTYVDENNWLRSWSHETYLWYDEIEDVDPACCTTPEYFGLMKTKETTSSGKPKDRFHFSEPTREYRQLSTRALRPDMAPDSRL